LHTLAGKRANEANMYVRGVVSTLGTTAADSDKNVLDINIVSSDRKFTANTTRSCSRKARMLTSDRGLPK
jgi:hypothetical protein